MTPKTPSRLQWHHIVALALAAFAFFMSGLVSERVFERLPHLEDEVAYLYQARIFAGGQITIDSPQPSRAFWQPFVLDDSVTGQRFGKYTPGWPLLLAVGEALGQAWWINATLAALTVALVYRLGREIFGADAGIIAALLTAFSPMALLLNATLMSHTAGLFYATLFVYAYWRLEQRRRVLWWGLLAGLALGALAATRPLTTLVVGLPFVLWSGARLLRVLLVDRDLKVLWRTLAPLLLLSAFTITLASVIPIYNDAATGDPTANLYVRVWEYDRVGFGEGYGRNTHRLEKAIRHARFDLSLTAADLFGWQPEPVTPEHINHFQNEADTYPAQGYSFVLLPIGIVLGLFWNARQGGAKVRPLWALLWGLLALGWALFPVHLTTPVFGTSLADWFGVSPALVDDPAFSWLWLLIALAGLYAPLVPLALLGTSRQSAYTWLLTAILIGIVLVQMTYWIGSQRYSTRYYYEALTAAALLSALPLAWLARRFSRPLIHGGLLLLMIVTLYTYSTPRITALYRFNMISPEQIAAVEARKVDDRPLLVIVNGTTSGDDRVRWRSYGSLMAVTDPYLDSEIVVVRDYGNWREELLAQFPDRQVIDIYAVGNDYSFEQP